MAPRWPKMTGGTPTSPLHVFLRYIHGIPVSKSHDSCCMHSWHTWRAGRQHPHSMFLEKLCQRPIDLSKLKKSFTVRCGTPTSPLHAYFLNFNKSVRTWHNFSRNMEWGCWGPAVPVCYGCIRNETYDFDVGVPYIWTKILKSPL